MRFRSSMLVLLSALLLTACNMTLAEDITPPPGAVQAPRATQAPAYPPSPPDPANGAAIYQEKCAACHGESGLGDGPQAAQLPVQVAALGAPEVAAGAIPADWFAIVTLGNIDNFMPPFASLSDQERWDVVAYALTLGTREAVVERGERLFAANCPDCPTAFFRDQQAMASISQDGLVELVAAGGEGLSSFGASLAQEERLAVAAYLRSLSFAAPVAAAPPTITPQVTAETGATPAIATAAQAGEQAAATPAAPGLGTVVGRIRNGSGENLPAGLTVTLYGFDHNAEPEAGAGAGEAVTRTTRAGADGAFRFEAVELPTERIFYAEVEYQGVPFRSELALADPGGAELTLPELTVYESTTESNALVTEELFVFTEFNADGSVRIFEQFYISNRSDRVVLVETDGTAIPILPMPDGITGLAFQPTQDSAPLLPTENGFALPPSGDPYGIIAFYTLPYEKKLELALPLALPVASVSVVVPEGVKVASEQLVDGGVREMQPGVRFQVYSGEVPDPSSALEMTISGAVRAASGSGSPQENQPLLIGIGAFGIALIAAGAWLYLRDRGAGVEEYGAGEEADGFESAEEIMDAIIALDDLHRAGKIPEEAYQARRAELKAGLKDLV